MQRLAFVLGLSMLFVCPAGAGSLGVNVGALEAVGEPGSEHLGVYPYVAVSMLFPVDKLAVIPAIGVEWSPEFGQWGFVGTVTADYPVAARIGLDLNVVLIHDQHGADWGQAAFLAGGGPGASVFHGAWTVSAYVNFLGGLNVDGWAITPGVNVARAL